MSSNAAFSLSNHPATLPFYMKTFLSWRVGHTSSPFIEPSEFVPATVPGAVQLDWARAHGWPQPEYDPDLSKYAWTEDAYWLYRAELAFELNAGERLFFVCKGVDYQFEVRLNGKVIEHFGEQEGMYTQVEIDLTYEKAQPGDLLDVLILPAPKSCETPVNRNQANQSCKPAVAYGWDFHPRLIPLGIWDEAYLEARPAVRISSGHLTYRMNDDLNSATVAGSVGFSKPSPDVADPKCRWTLTGPDGSIAARREAAQHFYWQLTLTNVALWWPHDQGKQNFYTSTVELLDADGNVLDSKTQRIGFRRVRLVMHPTQWQEPEVQVFPKGRHTSPITLEVNGRRIFAKGANWVTPSLFPGTVTADLYREHLTLMRDANMNIVRCWGGANVQKDAFFDLCDELGILVWQEFPLACNRYDSTSRYLSVLDQESRAIIQRVRRHPSLAMWCGGNELFNNWSLMTDQDLALRLLNRNCYDLDPGTPFLMTSPSMGMAHGGYFFRRPDGKEVYQYFAESRATAYTEFGVTGPASAATLRRIIPADELWPPRAGTQWETRFAFKAWQPDSWLDLPMIEDYFGPISNLESLVSAGQWLQAEGYKAIYEEARRQKPTCAMALCWVLNEPWPTAANNSLVTWPSEPKPALAAVAQACRPVLASARIPKFSWRAGETFSVQLFMLNDSPQPLGPGCVEAFLQIADLRLQIADWRFEGGAANTNIAGPMASVVLPQVEVDRMTLMLQVDGQPEWDSHYKLLYRSESC
jgi:beta-mannosidase